MTITRSKNTAAISQFNPVYESFKSTNQALLKNSNHPNPILNSNVSTGLSSPADDYLNDKLDLNNFLIQQPKSTFFYVANDSSMINYGIEKDDILLVDKNLPRIHGKIVVVFYGDRLIIRQIQRKNNNVSLVSNHPNFKSININKLSCNNLWGVVTTIIHTL